MNISSDSGEWASFPEQIINFLKSDLIQLTLDGKKVNGFRSPDSQCLWIRDHDDMMRGGRYFLYDMKSAVESFAIAQHASGRIYDNVTTVPEVRTGERENWEKWIRVPVEADVEYRFVKAVFLAWQSTGDHEWMESMLPFAEKALNYTMTHPWRWDPEHQLVKRAYTIDTWDFDYTAGEAPWLNFQITDKTFWGIFHGDNSGFYESAILLSHMYQFSGYTEEAHKWSETAGKLRVRANNLLFNGEYYTHFYKLVPHTIEGVDETKQLSLSNPMAINRGMATHEIAVAVIKEYQKRKKKSSAFAEWFSMEPPFPSGIFGDEKLIAGAYINGGIFPLAGGELALAAFEHGYEEYGVSILRQYRDIINETGETYLWYFPDGRASTAEESTSPDALPTDGWGSSAMLYAFVEGLCGVKDLGHSFRNVQLSPRWIASEDKQAQVHLSYPASEAEFSYGYVYDEDQNEIRLSIETEKSHIHLHTLLPKNKKVRKVMVDNKAAEMKNIQVEQSVYVDTELDIKTSAQVILSLE